MVGGDDQTMVPLHGQSKLLSPINVPPRRFAASRPGWLGSLALVAVLGTLTAMPARAQSVEELKAMVLKLQERVEQLEARQPSAHPTRTARTARRPPAAEANAAQQAAQQAQQAAADAQRAAEVVQQETIRVGDAAAEVRAATAPPKGRPGGSFRIPGTNTVVRVYGFAKANAIGDLTTQDQNDALTAQSIQLFGTAAQRQGGDTQISARRSRLDLETWTPVNDTFGEFHTLVEADFAGQNTSLTTQATANGYTPRLRKAYADFGKPVGGWGAFLFGQENSVFNDNSLLPIQWLNDATYVGVSNVRQAQFRYTYGFGRGVSAAVGVESPYSDVTTATGTSYPDSNGGGGVGWQTSPDLTARLVWKQEWGLLALRGVVRPQVALNNEGATAPAVRFNKSTTGYGLGLTAVVNLLDNRLVLMATGNAGNGLGRYLDGTAAGYGAVSNTGLANVTASTTSINAVGIYAGMVGLQYFFTPTIRTNMSLGGAKLTLPSYASQFGGCAGASITTGSCSSTNSSEWAGFVNLIWSPFKAVDLGLEYQHLERHLAAPFSTGTNSATTGGLENRIEASAIGRF
jgi:hypothetical protein